MKYRAFITSCYLLLLLQSARAQQFEKVLIPIAPDHVAGAYGSEWLTDIAVSNISDTPVQITREPAGICVPEQCQPFPLPAQSSAVVFSLPHHDEVRGMFFFVAQGRRSDIAITVRTRDESRQDQTWGTTLPVVGTEDLFSTRFALTDVPIGPSFRATLRIYDVNAAAPGAVRVRFYNFNPITPDSNTPNADALLTETQPNFARPVAGAEETYPASIELSLNAIPELQNATRVRVQVEPLSGGREYWGFVSVTNNTTQEVTVITPQ